MLTACQWVFNVHGWNIVTFFLQTRLMRYWFYSSPSATNSPSAYFCQSSDLNDNTVMLQLASAPLDEPARSQLFGSRWGAVFVGENTAALAPDVRLAALSFNEITSLIKVHLPCIDKIDLISLAQNGVCMSAAFLWNNDTFTCNHQTN